MMTLCEHLLERDVQCPVIAIFIGKQCRMIYWTYLTRVNENEEDIGITILLLHNLSH